MSFEPLNQPVAAPVSAASSPVPAIFGRRCLAYLLDLAFLYVFTLSTSVLCIFAYSHLHYPGDASALARIAASASAGNFTKAAHIFYYFSYFTIAHWYFGCSLGKWAMGLRVHTKAGASLSFPLALGRSLLYVVSGQLALGIGFLLPLMRKDGLTLHDLLAGTEVIDAKLQTGNLPVSESAAA
ncbi:MAG: RDD family protein [Bdellovibrionota bacterium]